jgi:polyhydroxyalkanoate synthesis regulator phasin
MIDPSIPLQVRTPSLAQVYMQAQQLKSMQQEQQLRTLSLAQATQGYQDQQDLRGAYAQSGGDPNAAVAALRNVNPYAASQEGARVAKVQADQAKAAADQQKVNLENTGKKISTAAAVLRNADSPQAWEAGKQYLVQSGVWNQDDLQHVGDFSPEHRDQLVNAALTAHEQITAEQAKLTAAETARHNKQTEATAAATQAETADYHGIEAKQRTQQLGIEGARLNIERQKYNTDNDASIESQAQQIASGDVKPLSQSRANPRTAAIMKRAYEINPKLSDSLYAVTQDLRSTKPNSMGANVGRLGTAILHGDRALENSKDLGFSEGLLTGVSTPGVAAYRQDAEFLTGEIGQYVTGGKLTVDEGKKLSKDLMSSRQGVRDAAVHEVIKLSKGKLQTQMQQFKNAAQQDFPTDRVFNDPDVNAALHKHGVLEGAAPAGGGKAGPPAGATHIVPGSDGKMHYTDGKQDLGVVQ